MKSKANFHIHTIHSDGGKTVEEVVSQLKDLGVTDFAITDHDCIDGNEEAARLAKEYGLNQYNGIELSCSLGGIIDELDENCVCHIVGLGFDLDKMRERMESLVKLDEDKEPIPPLPSVFDAVRAIKECGGIAIWAHPFDYMKDRKKKLKKKYVEKLAKTFRLEKRADISVLLDGIETYYHHYDKDDVEFLEKVAEECGYLKSIGTDYHMSEKDKEKKEIELFKIDSKHKRGQWLVYEQDGIYVDESICDILLARKVDAE